MSPGVGVTVQHIAETVDSNGGCALFIDYGHDGSKEDTFRVSTVTDFLLTSPSATNLQHKKMTGFKINKVLLFTVFP